MALPTTKDMKSTTMSVTRWFRTMALAVPVLVAAFAASSSTAYADFGFASFSSTFHDPPGASVTQAGAHPDLTTSLTMNTVVRANGATTPDQQLDDVDVDLPVGFYGNPRDVPRCQMEDFTDVSPAGGDPTRACRPETQVGVAKVVTGIGAQTVTPVYNLVPAPGQAAALGFSVGPFPITISVGVRSDSDYGLRARIRNTNQAMAIYSVKLTLWGVPADPAHDAERYTLGGWWGPTGASSSAARRPFLSLPARCDAPLSTTIRARSWQDQDRWVSATDTTAAPLTGCDQLAFDASMAARPVSPRAAAPSGYDIDLSVPQADGVDDLATPQVRKVAVTLPAGVTLSPSAATGLRGCDDADARLGTLDEPTCPDAATIGTVSVTTPLLDEPLTGEVIVRSSAPGHMFRLLLVARGAGVLMKLPGLVEPDPVTGQLTATFDNTPQLPFSALHMELKDGARAPLSNPPACGTYVTHATITPWEGPAVQRTDSFEIDRGCAGLGGFSPSFSAGVVNPVAGSSSPFVLRITRNDGEQALSKIDVDMPAGLLGLISNVARCPDAAAAAGTCGDDSQVGTVTIGAGPGSRPFYLGGKMFLTDGYRGAPFGLSIVVHAVAGPYDLGLVVVRSAIFIDPITAALRVESDPIPTILEGVPLQVRDIRLAIDRPGFMLAPTSCEATQIGGQITSSAGAVASVGNRFQVGGCAALPLTPRLALKLTGRGQTTDGKHPGLEATLTQPHAQSNLRKVKVALPLSLALDSENAQGLCEFGAGSRVVPDCPKESIVGTASVVTPILGQPLSGPVYFVKNVRTTSAGELRRTLPKLVIPLVGENGVRLTITGTSEVDADTQQLITTFDHLPDAPVSRFELKINGGQHGILAVSGDKKLNICRAKQIVSQDVDGQTGRQDHSELVIDTAMCPLRVLSTRRTSKALRLRVSGLGAGKVTVSGKGIRKTSRTLRGSTVATVTARLTKAGRKAKRYRVKVTFAPAAGGKARSVRATVGRHKVVAARKADGRVRGTSQRST